MLTRDALDDRRHLLGLWENHGPIVKAWLDGKVTTCIFGVQLGRKFLIENDKKITAATSDFTPLFPFGVLRQMNGDTHREYRRLFIDAFKTIDLTEHQPAVVSIVDDMLDELLELPQPVSRDRMRTAIKTTLTTIMFRLVLSIEPNWPRFHAMLAAYDEYAPNGTFKTARPVHIKSFREMRSLLLDRAAELKDASSASSLLDHFRRSERLDDTVVGNLLQMTEAGRFDLMGLWLWLLRMLAADGRWLEKIALEPDAGIRADLCQAAVMETLRLEQSEFLLRRASADIFFEGYFIPRGSIVRIAIWEAHKDATKFAAPFVFDPGRLLEAGGQTDRYGPFGLDKHKCLGADWVLRLSSLLVERIAQRCDLQTVADGEPELDVFHYEPSSTLAIGLRQRSVAA